MLRRELVDDEKWLDGSRFNRLLAVYQVLPGPEAHELAVHLGYMRGRRPGGLLAGLGFMLPGLLLMLLLSWLYLTIDLTAPTVQAVLLGAQVAVIALIIRAIDRIGRHVVVDGPLIGIALAAGLASWAELPFWVVLPVAGVLYVAARRGLVGRVAVVAAVVFAAPALLAVGTPSVVTLPAAPAGPVVEVVASPIELFVSGLQAGLLTFGGAYTAIPFVRGDAVGRGWLTDSQFLDGLALSGVLPAPLIIFSTFVGFLAGGFAGALAMTAGIFLPAFAFGILFGDRLEAVVENERLRFFLEGVAAGVVGLIVITVLDLAAVSALRLPNPVGGLPILATSLVVLYLWPSRLNVLLALALGALYGWLLFDVLA